MKLCGKLAGAVLGEGQTRPFKGRHFTSGVNLWALRWCLAFPVSHSDLTSMLADRGVAVDGVGAWIGH